MPKRIAQRIRGYGRLVICLVIAGAVQASAQSNRESSPITTSVVVETVNPAKGTFKAKSLGGKLETFTITEDTKFSAGTITGLDHLTRGATVGISYKLDKAGESKVLAFFPTGEIPPPKVILPLPPSPTPPPKN